MHAKIVICGAGIAGISAAYYLAVAHGQNDILLVDDRPPLSLTSDKSSEAYRNWWPGPGNAMVSLMNRSIDLMEDLARQSGDSFHLSRRGYVYATAEAGKIPGMIRSAEEISAFGAGPLRIHRAGSKSPGYIPAAPEGFESEPGGADLILDPDLLRRHFPYLTEKTAAALHVRRAGWFSGQQLGAYLLEAAKAAGVRLLPQKIGGVDVRDGQVRAARLESGERIKTGCFINAAGPLLRQVGRMLGVDLPVFSELHHKLAFKDSRGVIPRDAPLLIWSDSQRLDWSGEERSLLEEDDQAHPLLEELPPGAHLRPEGGPDSPVVLMLWDYASEAIEPVWPLPLDPYYPEVALRGLSAMIPGLKVYLDKSGRPVVDGGYYTKTRENRPLIGPLPVKGAYVVGALSGFGLMAACGAADLLARHVTGKPLPDYADAFRLERYEDAAYVASLEGLEDLGQL